MPLSFGFLSTYPPTQCGLATFTASLRDHLVAGGCPSGVVRVVDKPETSANREVMHHLVRGSVAAQARSALALDAFDVVVVQHEFGIYGGADGEEVLGVLNRLTVPVIVVAHTVLTRPTSHQREVLELGLVDRAATRGVADMVAFEASYLDVASLNRVVAQSDVVVLPYESREQVTSGVLIEAVAAGKPVVATAFPHAVELLATARVWSFQ